MEDFTEQEGFEITNDNLANWACKKIKEATEEADRLKKIITAERKELDSKEKAINEKLANETGYLKGLLFTYFGKVDHKETKTQSTYKLLDGSLVFKKPARKIVKPESETELVQYLEQNAPMLVETIKKPAWGEFKKSLTMTDTGEVVDTTTGEVVDFIKTEETEASFDVKVV